MIVMIRIIVITCNLSSVLASADDASRNLTDVPFNASDEIIDSRGKQGRPSVFFGTLWPHWA